MANVYVDLNVFMQLNSIILYNLIQTKYWGYKEKCLENITLYRLNIEVLKKNADSVSKPFNHSELLMAG